MKFSTIFDAIFGTILTTEKEVSLTGMWMRCHGKIP